mgnify:CR=1 FL=1
METTDHSRRCPGPTVVGMLVLVLVLVAGGCQTPIHLGRLATIKNPFTGSMKKIRFRKSATLMVLLKQLLRRPCGYSGR